MKNSLLATLMFTAMSWPVWTYAQPASDAMARTVKPDEMKWEPLEGGFEISITILKGNFTVAHDGSPDKTALAPGGFLYLPAKMIHEAWTGDGGATYFITVDGKWDVHFVE